MTLTKSNVRPNADAYARFVKRLTFRDGEADSPFCVVQGPVLADGEPLDARISRDEPLLIRTRDGLGMSEVLTSFVVHRDDLTFPADRGRGEWLVGGREFCIPPQTHEGQCQPETDEYDWKPVSEDETGEWWRVWLLVKPEFVYG